MVSVETTLIIMIAFSSLIVSVIAVTQKKVTPLTVRRL